MTDFTRARQPDQISLRRQTILDAAAELFDAEGPGAGLNAIAARAGFTKSNVYRYFESREDVLLALFLEANADLCRALVAALEQTSTGDVEALAATITEAYRARPRLCQLMSIFGGVLEQNVSSTTIEQVKTQLKAQTEPVIAQLGARLPGASREGCGWAYAMITALLAGMWPGVNPSPAAVRVLAKPQFSHMKLSLERDFSRAVEALLKAA